MDSRILDLLATIIGCYEEPRRGGLGHPRTEMVRVLATLRLSLHKGRPWRSLRATMVQASEATLRRYLARWTSSGPMARVYAMLIARLCGHPDLAEAVIERQQRVPTKGDDDGLPLKGEHE